jgi:hypothetical protein
MGWTNEFGGVNSIFCIMVVLSVTVAIFSRHDQVTGLMENVSFKKHMGFQTI